RWLVEEGILDRQGLQLLLHDIDEEIQRATSQALKAAPPEPKSALTNLYAPGVDPSSQAFSTAPKFDGAPLTMVDAINRTLAAEMARDRKILFLGEDVADCSREVNLCEVKGKGGVFKVTAGLQTEFGSERVFNTPLAEASIVGRAIGMATAG